jgi:hypothetical protein
MSDEHIQIVSGILYLSNAFSSLAVPKLSDAIGKWCAFGWYNKAALYHTKRFWTNTFIVPFSGKRFSHLSTVEYA